MKRFLWLGLILAGCTTPPSTPPTEPAPVVKESPAPTQVEPKPTLPTKQSANRIYQLDTLQKEKVKAPGQTLDAWIMDTDSKRQEGLMFLTEDEIKPGEGMLFVFSGEEPRGFWMENTLIPLDIVYMDAKGKVVSIAQGKALDETSLPSAGPAQYVLELKKDQAAKFGIKPGVTLGLPKVASKD